MNLDDLLHKDSPTRVWSPMQSAIFIADPPLIVDAKAGSGKTTTIVEKMNRVGGNSLFIAFNKAIAADLSTRVVGQTVKTFNALGHQILMRNRPGGKLDGWRVSKRFQQLLNPEDSQKYKMQLVRAVSLIKSQAIFDPSIEDYIEAMGSYELDIPVDLYAPFARICLRVHTELSRNLEQFDFDDQLYIPIKEGWSFPRFDYVFVDEAQDLSYINQLMVQRMADRGAQIVAVGDRNQAIYGFRGASFGSMDEMKGLFKMKELPLSISYRCARRVIEEAQKLVPDIQHAETAPEGIVDYIDYPSIDLYSPDDLIVCRNNAPIFSMALAFVRAKKQCRVYSNFLETIESFINQFDCNSTKDLRIKLDGWYKRERDAVEAQGKFGKLGIIEDKYEVLCELCKEFQTVGEIFSVIRGLSNSLSGPRISTIHRCKGTEAPRVFALRSDLIGARAETVNQQQQENNLRYVMITRAMKHLSYLPGEEQ